MKLTMTRVLTPLAALAIAFSAQAAYVANEGFEGSALSDGWNFVPGPDTVPDASTITAYEGSDVAKPETKLESIPDGFATSGDKFLKLSTEDGTLFRNVKTDGAADQLTNPVYLDTVVQFTATDPGDRPQATDEDKFIIWLESGEQGNNLRVRAGEYGQGEQGGIVFKGTKLYTLSAEGMAIGPGSWHRLTVKAVANALGEKGTMPAFEIYIDGTPMASAESAFAEEALEQEDGMPAGFAARTIFPSMNAESAASLTKVGFSGEGKLDDLVITSEYPSVVPHSEIALTWDTTIVGTIAVNGQSYTTSPALIKAGIGDVFTITDENILPAEGKVKSGIAFASCSAEFAEAIEVDEKVVGYTITAPEWAAGDAPAALEITFDYTTPTYPFALSWDSAEVTAVSYKIGSGDLTPVDDVANMSQEILAEAGAVITVEVVYAEGLEAGEWTADGGALVSGNVFTLPATIMDPEASFGGAIVAQSIPDRPFSVGGKDYSLAELNAAIADGSLGTTAAEPLTFAADTELAAVDSIVVPEGETLYVDLAGETLTAEGNAFTVAGTLYIADSDGDGLVDAEGDCVALDEGGVCNISGGSFSDAVVGATFPDGYELADPEEDDVFTLEAVTYTITYSYVDDEGQELKEVENTNPTSFTIETDTITIDGAQITLEGYEFVSADPTEITKGSFGDKDVTIVMKKVASGKELKPGEQDDTEYDDENAAKEAAAGITIAAAPAVVEALTADGALAAYLGKFEVKQVQKGTKWVNEVALTAAAASDLQTQANNDAAAVLDDTATTITTTPGFYYSLKQGTTLDGMTEGARKLATGETLTFSELGLDKSGNAGFYKVLVNITAE